jgi:hypothetical protein
VSGIIWSAWNFVSGNRVWWLEAMVDRPARVVKWRFRAEHLAVQFAARRGIRLEET